MRGVFVTGTDTGVGKTVASAALIHAVSDAGIRAVGMKPIAAGATSVDGRDINEDTVALMTAARIAPGAAGEVTPILLREPMAPHIAAARENRRIDLELVRAAFLRVAGEAQFVVVEGVGGFMVPLDEDLDTVDLARMLHLPVVMVVGMRLGCLNHALLTARAIAASGLQFAGWIANQVDPAMAVADENVAALKSRLGAPLLGRFPYEARPDPVKLARLLDVKSIIATDS